MKLKPVDRVRYITKVDFLNNYFKPQRPVIMEGLTEDWPAYKKWSLDFMKSVAGDKLVPLYDDRPVSADRKFNEAHTSMKMGDYIDLLKKEPTRYRIFLWNILKEVPALQSDFRYPDLGLSYLKGLPMLFFGGMDSYTFMHYDIDLANIFHIHFHGKKQAILFDQSQSPYLYKVPHSLLTREDINFAHPDYEKWPALKKANGYIADLEHGDILYMPEGYWHYMRYITPGFSMSLRSLAQQPKNLAKAVYNVFLLRHYDNWMRKIRGQSWIDWKNEQAVIRTHRVNDQVS